MGLNVQSVYWIQWDVDGGGKNKHRNSLWDVKRKKERKMGHVLLEWYAHNGNSAQVDGDGIISVTFA